MFSGLPKPAACAALTAFAPFTGVTNMTPCPGCSVRRASSISRFAPPRARASSLSAAPPARSSIVAAHTSAFVAFSAMAPSSGNWLRRHNASSMPEKATFAAVRSALAGSAELAMLDVREQGVHYRGHPFFACSAPLSRQELMIGDLVPRRSVPVVVLDGGGEGLAEKAAERLESMGYSRIAVLEGGCAGWQGAGGELFRGVNVPSKAFGEFVEHQYDTPRIPPEQLRQWVEEGEKLVILDSRPFEEYHRMNIPGGVDVPGAELVWRVHDLAPDPDTLVVVNCAGRTRSIIGCQSLRNAGIPNRVLALKDGTMGWDLAGFECERGATRVAPAPSAQGKRSALEAAERVAARFGVKFTTPAEIDTWQKDAGRTLYLLDVRTREEFVHAHAAGSRHAPGGQLVQASDEYLAVRNARIVLIDPERVRA